MATRSGFFMPAGVRRRGKARRRRQTSLRRGRLRDRDGDAVAGARIENVEGHEIPPLHSLTLAHPLARDCDWPHTDARHSGAAKRSPESITGSVTEKAETVPRIQDASAFIGSGLAPCGAPRNDGVGRIVTARPGACSARWRRPRRASRCFAVARRWRRHTDDRHSWAAKRSPEPITGSVSEKAETCRAFRMRRRS